MSAWINQRQCIFRDHVRKPTARRHLCRSESQTAEFDAADEQMSTKVLPSSLNLVEVGLIASKQRRHQRMQIGGSGVVMFQMGYRHRKSAYHRRIDEAVADAARRVFAGPPCRAGRGLVQAPNLEGLHM